MKSKKLFLMKPERLILKNREDAERFLKRHKLPFRYSQVNGKSVILTRDYEPTRYNLVSENGKIIGYTMG